MNIILRRCLGMLNMAMIKRKFYDPSGAENVAVNTINILSLFLREDLIFFFVFDRISTISLFGQDILRQFVITKIVFCWASI